MTKAELRAALRAARDRAFNSPRYVVSNRDLSLIATVAPVTLALVYVLSVTMDSVLAPATPATPLWLAFLRQAAVFTPAAGVLFSGLLFLNAFFPEWLKSREISAPESGKTGLAEAPADPYRPGGAEKWD